MNIGIIGLGDMGSLCARKWAQKGYSVFGCDLPERFEMLQRTFAGTSVMILPNAKAVARKADFLLYSVETSHISDVVQATADSIKYGAIVGGQTSVKHPEIEAFEKYLADDVHIVTCHSLHGPAFSTEGQKLVVVPHRANKQVYERAMVVYEALESEIIEIDSYEQHDQIMADTQAVTHMGFESMGTAWKNAGFYPWDHGAYSTGIDNVKILTTLRIFSYKAHVYAGMAILNPYARKLVRQYARSESELFKMMICENETEFRNRIKAASEFVFHGEREFITLDHDVMLDFRMAEEAGEYMPNSHLSLLAMVDAWYQMKVNPYENLICQTPPFRLRLGIAEYLFKNPLLLEETISTALYDKSIRADDLEFHSAVREWASIIEYGDMDGYIAHFNQVKDFFDGRLQEGARQSAKLIDKLTQ
ncbi:prephenate dehydrogenase (NADP+) [Arcticibacter tournemirensis]|uniref:Prephenate dehydrogenase n=1 Tax=Arcticibacter tournemirensis TaxID=699437 RepID=A0A5M9H884_9SPHI|nr:prephenate dehydrogenase [Arcticibacter tournemirensis]KAA8482081.1 prephenate dehydrogenase [Arcticibacter tournemirensis]TQM49493.1 prephenate dehydrogenase (NADP+) [Arcticibacter tournemirensis]